MRSARPNRSVHFNHLPSLRTRQSLAIAPGAPLLRALHRSGRSIAPDAHLGLHPASRSASRFISASSGVPSASIAPDAPSFRTLPRSGRSIDGSGRSIVPDAPSFRTLHRSGRFMISETLNSLPALISACITLVPKHMSRAAARSSVPQHVFRVEAHAAAHPGFTSRVASRLASRVASCFAPHLSLHFSCAEAHVPCRST